MNNIRLQYYYIIREATKKVLSRYQDKLFKIEQKIKELTNEHN